MQFLAKSEVAKKLGMTSAPVRQAADEGRLKVSTGTESGIRLFLKKDVAVFQHAKWRGEGNSGLAMDGALTTLNLPWRPTLFWSRTT